jgi:FkbM family methyltransferase
MLRSILENYRKTQLRRAVMRLPIDESFPFDLELRMLATTDLVSGPMLDIGANTGIYSAVLEKKAGANGLYLFEPLPSIAALLKQRFPHSSVFNMALSDRVGRTRIRVPLIDGRPVDTRATLNSHIEHRQSGELAIPCELSTVDAVVSGLGLTHISFMKIDVEGHELQVLRGAEQALDKYKPLVLIEVESRHHTFPLQRIFDEVLKHGYQGYFIRIDPYELTALKHFDAEKDQELQLHRSRLFLKYLNNFFFVPIERGPLFVRTATAFLNKLRPINGEASLSKRVNN